MKKQLLSLIVLLSFSGVYAMTPVQVSQLNQKTKKLIEQFKTAPSGELIDTIGKNIRTLKQNDQTKLANDLIISFNDVAFDKQSEIAQGKDKEIEQLTRSLKASDTKLAQALDENKKMNVELVTQINTNNRYKKEIADLTKQMDALYKEIAIKNKDISKLEYEIELLKPQLNKALRHQVAYEDLLQLVTPWKQYEQVSAADAKAFDELRQQLTKDLAAIK